MTFRRQDGYWPTQSSPVILVGHSYGGAVITEAGNDPQVVGLVYIAGWIPDKALGATSGELMTGIDWLARGIWSRCGD